MKHKRLLLIGAVVLSASGFAAFALMSQGQEQNTVSMADSRTAPQLIRVAKTATVPGTERSFTGTIAARIQSNVGFRVPGKIMERLVDTGQEVTKGQPMMRIDDTDLRLALIARRNAVAAAQAIVVQASADEKRYAILVKNGLAASPQRYEQAKATLDSAVAQLSAAQAEAEVAENAATYSTLIASADGTIVAALGEPGQVVAAGQTVIQLAQSGPREAVVALPETIRPDLGSTAEARVYGSDGLSGEARLRQISAAADAQTRTYEARYVLEGDAASAPLGATVTITISNAERQSEVLVPIAAVLDDGTRTGVWVVDSAASTVHFAPVQIKELGEETAVVTGLALGQEIVALGAHLLQDGAAVRTDAQAVVTY
jgi:RND family efflux transporter MFP subunit